MQKNILLVDNDFESIQTNKEGLESEGFNVTVVETAADAMTELNKAKPDAIVTEVMLEHSDSGFTLCYLARKKYPEIPIIILSDVVRKTDIPFDLNTDEEKEWIKANEFINKPINISSLACRIKKYL